MYSQCKTFKGLNDRLCNIIENQVQLEDICANLQHEQSLALCFKIYADRNNQFVCILQITSQVCDYIIDVIALRNQMFYLSKLLSNPNILKIVFDRELVLPFLRNLLYIDLVNVFDVYENCIVHSKLKIRFPFFYSFFLIKEFFSFFKQILKLIISLNLEQLFVVLVQNLMLLLNILIGG